MSEIALELLTDEPSSVALAQDYWARDEEGGFVKRVADLADQHGMRTSEVAKTVAAIAVARSTEAVCSRCGAGEVFSSRADFMQRRSWHRAGAERICGSCAATVRQEKAREEETKRMEEEGALWTAFGLDDDGVLPIDDMTLEQAITLLALIRLTADEKLERIEPVGDRRLSPWSEYDREILDELFARRLLRIDPTSAASAFSWEDGDPAQFFPFQVRWQVCDGGKRRVEPAQALAMLERALRGAWPDRWYADLPELWIKLALYECLEYLRVSLDDHGLDKKMGEKTRHTIENALRAFSIGQLCSFIWRAAKDAAAFYVRERVTKNHAANTVVLSIQSSAERAVANGWEVKAYGRDRRAPETPLTQLFASVTELGDRYWTAVPGQVETRSTS